MRLLVSPHRFFRLLGAVAPLLPSRSPASTSTDALGGENQPGRRSRSHLVELAFIVVFGLAILATYTWDSLHTPFIDLVNLPNLESVDAYERSLPQHNIKTARTARYLRFVNQHHWGVGFNNMWEEVMMLNEIALRTERGFVFRTWVLSDGSVRPMGLFLSGPTAGGPLPAGWDAPRAISTEWYEKICPPEERRQVRSDDVWVETQLRERYDGEELVSKFTSYLSKIPDRCIDVDGRGFMDLDFWFGSTRSLTLWPALSSSPILTHHAWSAAVYHAVSNNLGLITGNKTVASSERGSETSLPPLLRNAELSNVIALHIRRGDYEGHCGILAYYDAPYAAWNALPSLPDRYTPDNSSEATKQLLIPHCLPTPDQVAERVRRALKEYAVDIPSADPIERVYVMTNADQPWIQELRSALGVHGLNNVVTSRDLVLEGTGAIANQVVDMEIGIRAALFIGNGYSTFTSTIVALRLVREVPPHTNRFW